MVERRHELACFCSSHEYHLQFQKERPCYTLFSYCTQRHSTGLYSFGRSVPQKLILFLLIISFIRTLYQKNILGRRLLHLSSCEKKHPSASRLFSLLPSNKARIFCSLYGYTRDNLAKCSASLKNKGIACLQNYEYYVRDYFERSL